ncbi:hypothetical protein Dda_2592 [Drechslerella dactyloides]|uniref:Uncharacterized protein n=1 Tax=Drechslerella dactyloides TaxID=74499 RepID=A0AAD6IZS6_DREDA|nr:hypothetical protein Dda_2592 [Drechslerella dactyloides]
MRRYHRRTTRLVGERQGRQRTGQDGRPKTTMQTQQAKALDNRLATTGGRPKTGGRKNGVRTADGDVKEVRWKDERWKDA